MTAPARARAAARRLLRGASRRGRRRGDLGDPRRVRGARDGAMDAAGGLPRGARRDDREVAGGSARVRAALRPLLLPRRARPRRSNAGSARTAATTGGDRLDLDELREAVRQAIAEGRDGEMRDLARLAIAAFGRRGEGSGVIGVDVQRIRRTLGLQTQRARPRTSRRARPRADQPLRAPPAPRARAGADRAHREAAPLAAARRARPRAADEPDPGPRRRPPRRRAAQAPPGDPRPRAARAAPGRDRRHAPDDARLARDRAACRCGSSTGPSTRGDPRSTCSATSRPRSRRRASSSSRCCTRCTTRSESCGASSSSSGSPRSPTCSSSERDFRAISERISREGGVADVSGYTDYGRVWLEFLEEIVDDLGPALDGDRARRRPHERPRAPRRRLRPGRRARRPHLLAQSRAAPLLELRRLGDGRVRAPLHDRVRVLDDPPPGGLRERGRRRHRRSRRWAWSRREGRLSASRRWRRATVGRPSGRLGLSTGVLAG